MVDQAGKDEHHRRPRSGRSGRSGPPAADASGDLAPGGGRTASLLRYWLEKRPDLDAEALSIELTFARLSLLSRKSVARIAATLGISLTDYRIMAVIMRGRDEGALRPSDLWKLFHLTPGAITYRINRLVDRGLVDRSPQSGDRRVILLSLSEAGDRIVHQVMTELTVLMRERLAVVDDAPGGSQVLRQVLAALARRWEEFEESGDEIPVEE